MVEVGESADASKSQPFNPMDLSGRLILVTGASAGIGQAAARLVARLGARVVLGGRDLERLGRTHAELSGCGHALAPFDIENVDAIPEWIRSLAGEHGPFDGIAHCAGIQALRPIRSFSQDFFDKVMRINLGSAMAIARGVRRKECHTDKASLVLVASTSALAASPGNIVYAASKGGLITATRGLAVELVGDRVRVNCVVPATVETEMIERLRQRLTEDQYEKLRAIQPLGFGQPDDVAGMIAFLLADTARWMTGSVVTVDGGCSA